jgi:HSP20 family protein
MTFVKLNNKPAEKNFNSLMGDLWKGLPSTINEEFNSLFHKESVPVNIKQSKDAYVLEVVAPGWEKNDIKVSLDNKILTISAEKKNEGNDENDSYVRREYAHRSFKRSFTVDEKIDAANIQAKYENGVLTLNLPKMPEVKESSKEISIQ